LACFSILKASNISLEIKKEPLTIVENSDVEPNVEQQENDAVKNLKQKLLKKFALLIVLLILFAISLLTKDLNMIKTSEISNSSILN
jgi:hypothetical protein